MKKYIVGLLFFASAAMMQAGSFGPDDLFIRNNSNKQLGIFWLLGNQHNEKGIGNPAGPAVLAAKGQSVPGAHRYFANTDTKELKKDSLKLTMSTPKSVTGFLVYDQADPDNNQIIVNLAQFKTGTVKREGINHDVQKITITAPGGKLRASKGF
ncbi:MAG: hypothetical protein WD055_00400 [Candidatus Dependentiae bacterium]